MAEIKDRAKSAERKVRRPLFKGLREGLWRVTTLSDCIYYRWLSTIAHLNKHPYRNADYDIQGGPD
jgi:hypothetical protein